MTKLEREFYSIGKLMKDKNSKRHFRALIQSHLPCFRGYWGRKESRIVLLPNGWPVIEIGLDAGGQMMYYDPDSDLAVLKEHLTCLGGRGYSFNEFEKIGGLLQRA